MQLLISFNFNTLYWQCIICMVQDIYYNKYLKYKIKYIDLKLTKKFEYVQSIKNNFLYGGTKYDFFFIHATKNFSNLISILNNGYLYPGKYISRKHRFLGGPEIGSEYIYMNMYFKDLDNIQHVFGISLLLSPKMIYNKDMIFHEGWYGGNPLYLYKNDSKKSIDKKIEKIHKFLKNPESLHENLRYGFMNHQILTSDPISIQDNLIGIAINIHDIDLHKKNIDKVKKLLKIKGLNVPIYFTNEYKNIN